MSSVAFRNIVKRYGALTIIDDLNLQVTDGEFLVLLGPSGCGKTSLLHILAGLLPIEGGEVLIDGDDVTFLDPKDRGLAMVFQSYALYPTKTVRGNLKFGLSAQKLSPAQVDKRIDGVAKLLQIDHLLGRKPAQLSGGQRQRVAIGRALVKEVSLVLFDEPLSNLDAKLRTEMRMEIKKLHNRLGNTVIYVTHDQVEAMTMATRIAVMNKGVIQQIGTPDEIYEQPANLFVADFVGSPAMNVLDAILGADAGALNARDHRNGISVDLSGYRFKQTPRAGAEIRVGFRAEHFQPADGASSEPALRLELPMQFVEKVGSDVVAFLSLPQQTVAARLDQHYLNRFRGAPAIPVRLPLSTLNVFDARSGLRM
jgi:multiple sugar transport system ATP-binding protein